MGLKDVQVPFDPHSEEDVRVALSFYFHDLGYTLGEMRFEDKFEIRLGHSVFAITNRHRVASPASRATGSSDMLLTRSGKPLALVETKAPSVTVTESDRDQALSYARLLREMPPYTVVTNGTELRVFDTINGDLIASGSPRDSEWWKHGGAYQRADKVWAARTLLTLNRAVLLAYCKEQVTRSVSDLKGDIATKRRYVPELYVPRRQMQGAFNAFLSSNYLCFAIVGESGIGKTNELCALAESLNDVDKPLALFYRAATLTSGLAAAIQNDFLWEFEREEPISRILGRFAELAETHRMPFVILVDGLDEFPGALAVFKAELVDLVSRLNSKSVRICVTCKSSDWNEFVRDRGESLSRLGEDTFPTPPDTKQPHPGVILESLNEDELNIAWLCYSRAFAIGGELKGETRKECHLPLMLRVVSEAYQNSETLVPADLTDEVIFDNYWLRKLGGFQGQQRLIAERILADAAEWMISRDQAEMDEQQFFRSLEATLATHPVYEQLTRYGLLTRHSYPVGLSTNTLSFAFEKLRSYVYTVKSRKWPQVADPNQLMTEVNRALETRLGRDALIFYLSTIDSEPNGWLTPLIESAPGLFMKAVTLTCTDRLRLTEVPLGEGHGKERLDNRMMRFIQAYSGLRDKLPALMDRLAPYLPCDAGLWVCGEWSGYRGIGSQHREPILAISVDLLEQMRQGEFSRDVLQTVLPDGRISNALTHELMRHLPESVALSELDRQLDELFTSCLLDESTCPVILAERIHDSLEFKPNVWFQGVPKGHFWEYLGFTSVDEALSAPCTDLNVRIGALLRDWQATVQKEKPTHGWYRMGIAEAIALGWHVAQYMSHSANLPPRGPRPHEMFEYLRAGSLDQASITLLSLVPSVISCFTTMVEVNFPYLLDDFATYRHRNARLVVELSQLGFGAFQREDLLASYIFLPSAPPGPPIIRAVPPGETIAKRLTQSRRSIDNGFARGVELLTRVDGELIQETHAVVSRISYPDAYLPITDQVYQLLANEADEVFGTNSISQWGSKGWMRFEADKAIPIIVRRRGH